MSDEQLRTTTVDDADEPALEADQMTDQAEPMDAEPMEPMDAEPMEPMEPEPMASEPADAEVTLDEAEDASAPEAANGDAEFFHTGCKGRLGRAIIKTLVSNRCATAA